MAFKVVFVQIPIMEITYKVNSNNSLYTNMEVPPLVI